MTWKITPITDFKIQPAPYFFSHFLGKPKMTEEQFSGNTRELFLHVSRENRIVVGVEGQKILGISVLALSLSLFFFL